MKSGEQQLAELHHANDLLLDENMTLMNTIAKLNQGAGSDFKVPETPMIKEIQKLRRDLEAANAQVAALKNGKTEGEE